jgi:predicted Rossmann fold nucleotide-binding protein DprA/Smf involved in DNA uptake
VQLDASLSWLALGLTPGLASRLSARVLRRLDSPDGVFRAALPDLEACHLPAQVSQAIVKKEAFKRAENELAGIQKIAGCSLLNWTEPEYPQTLLQIYDPPVLLYVRGDAQVLNLPSLGIVGTRRPTLYGTQLAQRLGRDLAARGSVIVSAKARGIDAIGHQGAMDAHGRAIGVLGTGIDVCYPKENKKLYVIEELPTPIRAALVKAEQPEAEQRNLLAAAALNDAERKLYDLPSAEEPVHIDDIVERSGLNSSEVLARLFELEMKGIVPQSPGKQFSKVLR